jgi:hypothetical protein
VILSGHILASYIPNTTVRIVAFSCLANAWLVGLGLGLGLGSELYSRRSR